MQTSEIPAGTPSNGRPRSVAGQGIHSDGTDRCMLTCVTRNNVKGALNSFFNDLKGDDRICEPRVLAESTSVLFKDDEIFHYISNAEPTDPSLAMERTVVIINADAESQLTGKVNDRNNNGALKADNPLRLEEEFKDLIAEDSTMIDDLATQKLL